MYDLATIESIIFKDVSFIIFNHHCIDYELTLLFLSRFITDCGSDRDRPAISLNAPLCADENAEARFLEDVHIVVVCISHGPPRGVLFRLLTPRHIDETAVTVRPLFKRVVTFALEREREI